MRACGRVAVGARVVAGTDTVVSVRRVDARCTVLTKTLVFTAATAAADGRGRDAVVC